MRFQEVFKRLNGREATAEDVLKFERLTSTLETTPGDAMLAVLVALDHYERLYAGIPAKIQEAAQKAASGAAAQAQVNNAVAQLVPSVEKAVTAGARAAIGRESLGKSAITLILAGLIIGLVFGAGMFYGARIFATAAAGNLTWANFWSWCGWSLGLGASVPGLLLVFGSDLGEETTWWQWLCFVLAIGTVGFLIYRLATGF